MTGIEKLRAICGVYYLMDGGVQPVSLDLLKEIADQIERETLPRPLFEDGTPVQFGDKFLGPSGVCAYDAKMFKYYSDGRVVVDGILGANASPLKRPEPPDTWEKLEKCSKDPCEYFGGGKICSKCPVERGNGAWSCTKAIAEDLVRRCKALAGVE